MADVINSEKLVLLYKYWDKKKKLPDDLKVWWKSLSTSVRLEIRHAYEFEEDE